MRPLTMLINQRHRCNRHPQGRGNDPRDALKSLLWCRVENIVSAEDLETELLVCFAGQLHLPCI